MIPALRKILAIAIVPAALATGAQAQTTGVTERQILIGQTMAYSGPLSMFGTVGRAMSAYFDKINDDGGVNGRKIKLVSLDDAFSPPKAVEQTRKLVEGDEVLLIAGSLGTATGIATQKYLNGREVPQLLVQSGSSAFNNPGQFPWSLPGLPSYVTEARVFSRYILSTMPGAKIAVLIQNDDFGRDYMKGLKDGLGGSHEKMIVSTQSFTLTDPTIDSQIVSLKASGADTLVLAASGKATAQALRKAFEIGWRPTTFVPYVSNSVTAVLQPAGLEASTGIISAEIFKDPGDPAWHKDADYLAYRAWMAKYYPSGNPEEKLNVSGYTTAQMLIDILRRCGNDLSRKNAMKQAASFNRTSFPMLLPQLTVQTDETDYSLFRQFQLRKFDGSKWVPMQHIDVGNGN
ncbi:MAG TPA: ABC transporter substrate-binding protein [Bradyrhizobium sp.]|jgi:ABC-type branched-subunit amino acid transport system substrate-binding protein|nr:ABC transporter substrate-binding protein [Bradyrhizobium sp.]